MQIFKLDSVFKPGSTITFDSSKDTFIWTERYQQNGEFRIVIRDDISILTELPRGSFISHTDTLDVMIVEDHIIKRNADRSLDVTVSGRSWDTFLENRTTGGTRSGLYDLSNQAINEYWIDEAEDTILGLILLAFVSPVDANDAVANTSAQKSIRVMDPLLWHTINRGSVYSAVQELLKLSKSGLKTIRPNGALTTLDITIHDGIDRLATVIFRDSNGDLEEAEYLWSTKSYKNYAQIATHITSRLYKTRDLVSTQTGLNRRTMYVGVNELEGEYFPPLDTDEVGTRAQVELDNNRQVTLIGAKISLTAKPKFKLNYDIGDLVTVAGEFSTTTAFQVTEHILTLDKDGIRGYPTLSVL